MATMKHPYNMKLIPVKEINFNRLYQRQLDRKLLKHIKENFDYHEVNPVKVVYRDGSYYAFDGQHTASACELLFGGNYLLPCMVYDDIPTWVEEAIYFEKINAKQERRPVSTYALWKSKNNRGEEMVTTIRKVVEQHGFILHGSDCNGNGCPHIKALEALESVTKQYGEQVLDETLDIIQKSWHGSEKSVQARMLKGIAFFVNLYNGQYRKESLINQLRKNAPEKIKDSADKLKAQEPPILTRNDIAFKIAQIYNNFHGSSQLSKLDIGKLLK